LISWDNYIPPLLGSFFGVLVGFYMNNRHRAELDRIDKSFFLYLLRLEIERSRRLLLADRVNLLPTETWNSIEGSGRITLFSRDLADRLGKTYSDCRFYNYEAKIVRDAEEHWHLLGTNEARKRCEQLKDRLSTAWNTYLGDQLLKLQGAVESERAKRKRI
jgi:hypothetical protein